MGYEIELDGKDPLVALLSQAAELRPLIDKVGVKGIAEVVAIIKIVLEIIAAIKKLRS